ncbi:MAG: Ig-like domain-containing protein [Saprospiraceae bacterium]
MIPVISSDNYRDIDVIVPMSEMTSDGRYITIKVTDESGTISASTTLFGHDPALGDCCFVMPKLTLENVPGNSTSITIEIITNGANNPDGSGSCGQSWVLAASILTEVNCCETVEIPGNITGDQSICDQDVPSELISLNPAIANPGGGLVTYQWFESTTTCDKPTGLDQYWNLIPGATSLSYTPGPISVPTCYVRAVKEETCDGYNGFSNVVSINYTSVCGELCYALSEYGDGSLYSWENNTNTYIGSLGVSKAEAMTFNHDGTVLYATDAGRFGTINTLNANFTFIANVGMGNGSDGLITMSDIDGLALNSTNGLIMATNRRASQNDVLFAINPLTGTVEKNYFGSGVDYRVIYGPLNDIDDVAFNPSNGQLYGVSTVSGGSDPDQIIVFDQDHVSEIVVSILETCDIEGLTFDNFGQLYGSTGYESNCGSIPDNSIISIDYSSNPGNVSLLSTLAIGDTEALACFVSGPEPCVSVEEPGRISGNQTICTGDSPSVISNVSDASSTSAGAIEYQWYQSTTSCSVPLDQDSEWTLIPGATSTSYTPGLISVSTCFVRGVKKTTCPLYYKFSNVVRVGFDVGCLGCVDAINLNGDLEQEGTATNFNLVFENTPALLIDPTNRPLAWANRYDANQINTNTFIGPYYLNKTSVEGDPHSGSHFAYLKGDGICLSALDLGVNGTLNCGTTYRVSVWVAAYSTNDQQLEAPFEMEFYAKGDNVANFSLNNSFTAPASYSWNTLNWNQYFFDFTVPESGYDKVDFVFTSKSDVSGIVIDDVCIMEIDRGSGAIAGPDVFNCSNDFVMEGNVPSGAYSGTWSVVSGGATITDPTSPSSNVVISSGNVATLRWTITDGDCTSFDDINIAYENSAPISVISTTICEGESVTLSVAACNGSVMWSTGETTSTITVTPGSTTDYTVSCTSGTSSNLVQNPGFENGFSDWSDWADAGVVNSNQYPVHSGTGAGRADASTVWAGFGQDIAVVPGQAWELSLWARTDDVSNNGKFVYYIYDANWVKIDSFYEKIISDTYTEYNMAGVTPPGAAYIIIGCGTSPINALFLDDVSFITEGCTKTATSTITVHPQPVITVTDDVTICTGDDAVLTASVIGGTVSSSLCYNANWEIDEGAGSTISDAAGIFADKSITGASWTTRPNGGSALDFNGTTDHIDLGNDPNFNMSGNLTISMWLKPDNFSSRKNPWAKAYGGEGTITQEQSGGLNFYWGTSGNNASPYEGFGTSGSLTLNQWNHIVIVRDITNGVARWYINGVLNNTKYTTMQSSVSTRSAFIGKGYTSNYDGGIDDVKVFDCALSGSDVTDLFNGVEPSPLVWDNGLGTGSTKTVSPVSTTTYTVSMTDDNGCSSSEQVTVLVDDSYNPGLVAGNEEHCGGYNPSVISGTAASGCNSNATEYSWQGKTESGSFATIVGANGTSYTPPYINATKIFRRGARETGTTVWTYSTEIDKIVNPIPTASINNSAPLTCGNATITLEAVSNIAGVTYQWTGGETTNTKSISTAGVYSVTITDPTSGCFSIDQTTITLGSEGIINTITADCSDDDIIVNYTMNGAVAQGTMAVYNIGAINSNYLDLKFLPTVPGNGIVTFSGLDLSPGTYEIRIFANNNFSLCSTDQFTINAGPNASAANSGAINCTNATTTLTASPAGMTYLWSNGVTTQTQGVSAAGVYTVTVTDNVGCGSVVNTTVIEETLIDGTLIHDGPFNCNQSLVTLTANSTTAGVVYSWNGGGSSNTKTVNVAGTYEVTITDPATGCSTVKSANVDQAPDLIADFGVDKIICEGSSVKLIVPAGQGTYSWSNGAGNTASISVSPTINTTYSVTVTDTHGCTASDEVNVIVSPSMTVEIDYNGSLCLEDNSELSAIISGGIADYTYSWTGPSGFTSTAPTISIVESGNYHLTVTDFFGCTANVSGFVHESYNPFIINLITEVCAGESVTLNATSPTAVSFLWSTGETSAGVTVTPSAPSSTYTVTVTNDQGCTGIASASIDVNLQPTVSIVGPNTICEGGFGSVSPQFGGTWTSSNPSVATVDNTGNVEGVSAGIAYFTFTSFGGCVGQISTPITVVGRPIVDLNGPSEICINEMTQLTSTAIGLWTSSNPTVANVNGNGVVTGYSAGTAIFSFLENTNGCSGDKNISITVNPAPTISYESSSLGCIGDTTQLISSDIGEWVSTNPSVAIVDNNGQVVALSSGITTFSFVSDLTDCESVLTPPFTVNAPPTINIDANQEICIGFKIYALPNTGGSWESLDPTIASITDQGEITGVSVGKTSFVFTSFMTGCKSDISNEVTILGGVDVDLDGETELCIGETTLLTSSEPGIWSSNNSNIASITIGGQVLAISSGTVEFSFISSATSCEANEKIVMTIHPSPFIVFEGLSDICIGSTTTILPSTNGQWISNNPTVASIDDNGNIVGLSEGNATFTYTDGTTGCSNTSSEALLVYSNPIVTVTGLSTICIGDFTTLSPTSGGTWTSSDPSIASIAPNGVVTAISAGSATFVYTETGSECVSDDSAPITILPKPSISITGNSQICQGDTIYMSPSTGGAWISSDEQIAIIFNDGTVIGTGQGIVRFTFIGDNGCQSDQSAPIIVNGLPNVIITGSPDLCLDGDVQLLPSSGGQWTSLNPAVATVNDNGVVSAVSAGTTNFYFIDSNTGCKSDLSGDITVLENPTTVLNGPDNICVGETTNFTPSVDGAWMSLNPSVASIQNNGEVTGISAGQARFIYTELASLCSSDTTDYITVNAGPTIDFDGPSTLCIGDTTFMSPSSGGVWTSMDESIAIIDDSGMVISKGQGLTKFRFVDSSTGCTSELSAALLVNSAPTVFVSGPPTICIGSTTMVSASTAGFWQTLSPTIASVDINSGEVYGISEGIAFFKYYDSATGCSSDGTLSITVQPATEIEISGDSEICIGYSTNLSPSIGGYWISNNPTIASVTNTGLVIAKVPGKVTFTFTSVGSGCSSEQTTGDVTVMSCTNNDLNVTSVNNTINGNVSTNDNTALPTTYNNAILTSKPLASNPQLDVNADGTYSFVSNIEGIYSYNIPVCISPITSGCPTTILTITVVDNIYSVSTPVANYDFATTYANVNSALPGQTVAINTLANDKCVYTGGCAIDPSTVTVTNVPSNGTTTVDGAGVISYTPNAGFIGFDTLSYQVCDDYLGNCHIAEQIITVNDVSAVNSIIADDDFNYTMAGSPVSGDALLNDMDPEGDIISIVPQGSIAVPVTTPDGSYFIDSNGNYTFTPNDDFVGGTEIIYTICDNQTPSACSNATIHILVFGDMTIKLRAYLEGPILRNDNETSPFTGDPLMRDDLRNSPFTGLNYIPVKDPYTYSADAYADIPGSFNKIGPGLLTQNTIIPDSAAVFSVTGDNAIVDWIHVELRSKDDMTLPIATRSGLIQRDGDIVDLDGVSDLKFNGINIDSFYVVIKHRSHLGAMTMKVSNSDFVDFTSLDIPMFDFGTTKNNGTDYTGLAQKSTRLPGYNVMWGGDFNCNGTVQFEGGAEDDLNILQISVLFNSPTFYINYNLNYGYFTGDFDMNSKAKFTNPDDDKNDLFEQVFLYPLNTVYATNTARVIEQIPND